MVPLLGWAMWFNEFGFLTRSKSKKDLATLHRASAHFKTYNEPVWLLLYPEGTRFTPEKHQASIEFAKEKNVAHYKNLLIPRPKGFNELTTSLKVSRLLEECHRNCKLMRFLGFKCQSHLRLYILYGE